MKTLLVLRHAKSSWEQPGLDDHARPLNARGERDAPRMGRLVRAEGLTPDLIISSDAARARATAEAMAEAARYPGTILLEPRLYHADTAEILDVLRTTIDEDVASVMIVGHNPGLEELVAWLTSVREPSRPPRSRRSACRSMTGPRSPTTRGTLLRPRRAQGV